MVSAIRMNINSVMRALSLWKQHRCPDAKTTDCRASEPFELVHERSVCGPISVSSLGESR